MSPGLSSKRLQLTIILLSALMVLPAWGEQKIVLDGSGGMLPLANALAKAYQQKFPDSPVELGKGLGTGERIKALAEGNIQIALSSQAIQPEDMKKGNLKVIQVAKGAVVFAVNASVPFSNITERQICDIFSGNVRGWQSLGGPDSSIAVLTRPPAEVDPQVIREKVGCFKDLKEAETAKVMASGADMAKGLAETADAVGMTSMTVVEQSGGKVKALTLNGIPATAENVKSGRYFLTRDFLFVIEGESTPPIKKFLDFILSADGDRVILANGAVPLR